MPIGQQELRQAAARGDDLTTTKRAMSKGSIGKVVVVLLGLLALAGCGSGGTSSASAGGNSPTNAQGTVTVNPVTGKTGMPVACADILKDGAVIPAGWDGSCYEATSDTVNETPLFACQDGSKLYGNDPFWGFAGKTMHKVTGDVAADAGYKTAYNSCESPTTPAKPEPSATSTETTSSRSTATGSLTKRLQAVGIDCQGQQMVGDVTCNYQGKQVTVSTTSWQGSKNERQAACDQGYINHGYVVATDEHNLTVAADDNTTTQAAAKALGLRIVAYCPS